MSLSFYDSEWYPMILVGRTGNELPREVVSGDSRITKAVDGESRIVRSVSVRSVFLGLNEESLTVGKVYVDQPYLLKLESGHDLSSAGTVQIKVFKPSGATATWSGTVANTTKIQHSVTGAENNESGEWKFQTDSDVLNDGSVYPGETFFLKVHARGT